jgi:hypothetical protein
MSKRVKKTLPNRAKSADELRHERAFAQQDPTVEESLSARIQRHAAPPPKGTVFARDMVSDEVYLNYERVRRLTRLVEKRKDGKVVIAFYAGELRQWLTVDVDGGYPLSKDLSDVSREQDGRSKEAEMAAKKIARKHAGAGKPAPAREARAVSEKTGCKVGSIGDAVGQAILEAKTEEEVLKGAKAVVRAAFQKKGKGTDDDAVTRQARAWIGALKKDHPKLYSEHLEKVEAKSEKASKKAEATA